MVEIIRKLLDRRSTKGSRQGDSQTGRQIERTAHINVGTKVGISKRRQSDIQKGRDAGRQLGKNQADRQAVRKGD
jgi:hypothetical protein